MAQKGLKQRVKSIAQPASASDNLQHRNGMLEHRSNRLLQLAQGRGAVRLLMLCLWRELKQRTHRLFSSGTENDRRTEDQNWLQQRLSEQLRPWGQTGLPGCWCRYTTDIVSLCLHICLSSGPLFSYLAFFISLPRVANFKTSPPLTHQ